MGRAVRRGGAPRRGPAGRQRPHSRPSGAGRHRGRRRGRSLTCHLPPDAAGGPSQPSEVPWSSPTASTAGATGARTAATTAATTETTAATTAETASSTDLKRRIPGGSAERHASGIDQTQSRGGGECAGLGGTVPPVTGLIVGGVLWCQLTVVIGSPARRRCRRSLIRAVRVEDR